MLRIFVHLGVASIVWCTFLVLSLYGGFSKKADVFCTMQADFPPSSTTGPGGLVVLWLRGFSIFLITSMALLGALWLVACARFDINAYKKNAAERWNTHMAEAFTMHGLPETPPPAYESDSYGCHSLDVFRYYESDYNIYNIFLLCAATFWLAWWIFGMMVARILVPWECRYEMMGDNTSLMMVYAIHFSSIVLLVMYCGFFGG